MKEKANKRFSSSVDFLIENFKGDYSYYKSHFQKYDYPYNLDEEQIIELIFHWLIILLRIELSNQKYKAI